MEKRTIWISSVSHLNRFTSLVKNRQSIKNTDFPHVRALTNYIPVIFFSKGTIEISDKLVSYVSIPSKKGWIKSYYNLDSDLRFSISFDEIDEINRYQYPEPILNAFNTNWIRLKTKIEILKEDILIAQSGNGPSMNGIIQGTNEIYNILMSNNSK